MERKGGRAVKSIPCKNKRRSDPVFSFSFLLQMSTEIKTNLINMLIAFRLAEFQEIYPDKFSRKKHVSCDNFVVLICKSCRDNVQLNQDGGSL